MAKTYEVWYLPAKIICKKCHTELIYRDLREGMDKGIAIVACIHNGCEMYDVDIALTLPTAIGVEVNSMEVLEDIVMDKQFASGSSLQWKKHEYQKGGWIKLPEPEEPKRNPLPVKAEILPPEKPVAKKPRAKRKVRKTS